MSTHTLVSPSERNQAPKANVLIHKVEWLSGLMHVMYRTYDHITFTSASLIGGIFIANIWGYSLVPRPVL